MAWAGCRVLETASEPQVQASSPNLAESLSTWGARGRQLGKGHEGLGEEEVTTTKDQQALENSALHICFSDCKEHVNHLGADCRSACSS